MKKEKQIEQLTVLMGRPRFLQVIHLSLQLWHGHPFQQAFLYFQRVLLLLLKCHSRNPGLGLEDALHHHLGSCVDTDSSWGASDPLTPVEWLILFKYFQTEMLDKILAKTI